MKTKRFSLFLLLCLLACCLLLAACNNDSADPGAVDPADPDGTVQPYLPQVTQLETPDEIQKQVKASMTLPEAAEDVVYSVIDETIGQAQFTIDGVIYIARVSKGQVADISQMESTRFGHDESTEEGNLQIRLRYFDFDAEDSSDYSYGIGEVYDSGADTTYMVLIYDQATPELLRQTLDTVRG